MATLFRSMARKRGALLPCLLYSRRHSHTQSLWEQLLGRKIEPSAAKALDDAFLEFRVSQAVPSWLPFLPNYSFWIPSAEDTMKNLEVLAQRLEAARPVRKKRIPVFEAPPEWSGDGAVSKSAAWSAIQVTDKLMNCHAENPIEKGTIIVVDARGEDGEEGDEDDEDDEEEEVEIVEVTKV